MTKWETQILKGVAILLMICLHLFNQVSNVELCRNYLFVGGMPFLYWLTPAMNPVSFFLILSGYGMHYIHARGTGDKNRFGRVLKLYTHWWVILVLFVLPCCLIGRGDKYLDLRGIINNVTAFNTTWYGEGWFLFPFICLSLLSPWLFKLTDRFKPYWIIAIAFIIGTGTSFVISRYGGQYLYGNMWVYNPFLIVHLVPAFLFGAMLQRTGFVSKYQDRFGGMWNWGALIAVVFVMCLTRTSAWGPFYATSFILFFLSAPRWAWLDNVLAFLGKHSMNMWLIHAWFCYYIFHDEVYALRYPLLIFLAVTIISLVCSLVVNLICDSLNKFLCFKQN